MSGSTRTEPISSDAWRQLPTVFVVDDDAAVLDGLSELFESEGYGVATARDGWSALEKLRGGLRPSVILLDLMMPAMDGWDFRQAQLRDVALKDISVVVLTAAGFSETSIKVQFGDIEFVAKPPDVGELLGAVRRRLGELKG
jgi:two-component system, chemotaxis family, chemotaxis protein CheY